MRGARSALLGLVFAALLASASGRPNAQDLDALPKHPIPYKVLQERNRRAAAAARAARLKATQSAPTPGAAPKGAPGSGPASAPVSGPAAPAPAPASSSSASAPEASQGGPNPGGDAGPAPSVPSGEPNAEAAPAQGAPNPPGAQSGAQSAQSGAQSGAQAAKPAPPAPPPPAALAAPPMAAGLGPHDPLSSPEVQSFVDGQAVAAMNNNHVAGLVVSVVQDGKLVMEKGYGTASRSNGSAMDPRRTMIRLGSVSQLFTWIALLKAVEAGRLSLDDPVNRRLPEALQIPDEGFDRPILLRHLMSQTAGFEDRALGRRFTRDPARILPLEEALKADRPRRVRAAGLVSIPSDYSAALAGEIVARTAGRPFDQLLEMEIFRPLGLDHTTFREPYPPREDLPEPLAPALADDLGEAFHWGRSGLEPEPTFYGQSLAPALSASSTADDMARLMIALLSGGAWEGRQIYGPATARLISVPLPEPIGPAPEWAHGLALLRLVGGETALVQKGSALGFHSSLFLAPGLNLGVFVGVNTDSGGPAADDLPSALVARFYGPGSGGSARPTAGGPSPEGPAPSNAPQAWGRYLSAQRAYHGLEAFADRLTLGSSLDGEPGGQDLTLTAAGASRVFHPVAENLYQAASGVELFLPPVSGGPQAYILGSGGGAAERVGGLHSVAALAVLCAAGAFAALASLAGLFMRDRADQRETRAQVLANAVQIVTCLTWCAAFATFGVFVAGGLDRDRLMFDWPNQWLVTTSWLALGGGVLTLAMAMQLPGVWREGRRIHGWSVWRKLRYSARLCTFLALTAVLAAWGVLEPWSS